MRNVSLVEVFAPFTVWTTMAHLPLPFILISHEPLRTFGALNTLQIAPLIHFAHWHESYAPAGLADFITALFTSYDGRGMLEYVRMDAIIILTFCSCSEHGDISSICMRRQILFCLSVPDV